MLLTNCYATLAELKARLGITDTNDDAILKSELETASRSIDTHCRRRFFVEARTRYYTARWGDLLEVDDLVAVTTLKTDEDGDRTYETVWEATDYDLTPFNAPYEQKPYTAIEVTPSGRYAFATVSRGVEIAANWGYYQYLQALDTLAAAITSTSATSLTATAGSLWSPGMTVLVGSEQMHVEAVSGNTITVTRGVNGTTAATALINAAVQVYTYPVVNEACLLLAARLFKRKDSPLGIMGSLDTGYIKLTAREDPQVVDLLWAMVKHSIGSVG